VSTSATFEFPAAVSLSLPRDYVLNGFGPDMRLIDGGVGDGLLLVEWDDASLAFTGPRGGIAYPRRGLRFELSERRFHGTPVVELLVDRVDCLLPVVYALQTDRPSLERVVGAMLAQGVPLRPLVNRAPS
jgi:hypothetical protein